MTPFCRIHEDFDVTCAACRLWRAFAEQESTPPELLPEGKTWKVLQGDALALLRFLPSGSIDAVITDPPYSSGGFTRGDRMGDTTKKYVRHDTKLVRPDFAGDNRDQRGFSYWCALWLSECLRVCKPGAPVCIFTDWRQLPTMTDAIQAGGWIWRGVVPWDKGPGVRPQMGRFASQAEYIVWGSAGPLPPRTDVGCLRGVFRQLVKDEERELHITPKPVELLEELVAICPPGGIVLDPFCGSGPTGVAALRRGRRFLGLEIQEGNAATASDRILADCSSSTLEAARAGQAPLFPTEKRQ